MKVTLKLIIESLEDFQSYKTFLCILIFLVGSEYYFWTSSSTYKTFSSCFSHGCLAFSIQFSRFIQWRNK